MRGCGDVSSGTQTVEYLFLRSERVSHAVACRSTGNRVPKLLRPLRFTYLYYMTSSASGQDEPNLALWLATRAGKILFIMFWCFIPYNKSFIGQACSVKMAGYWPRSFFACLWTSTSSRSINMQKTKNLANIQPSWPHAWSITHTYFVSTLCGDRRVFPTIPIPVCDFGTPDLGRGIHFRSIS